MDGDFRTSTDGVLSDGIRARLNYLQPGGEKPFAYQYDPPPGRPQRSGRYAEHQTLIGNGRKLARTSLDVEGFALARHATAVSDLYDGAAVKSLYYPEAERLVQEATGARRVAAFDHNLRNAAKAKQGVPGFKEPVPRVHNDYTTQSAPQRVRDLLGAEAEGLIAKRFAFVNLWRPIAEPVEDWALAVCDARSIAPEDLVASDLIYPDRVGETYAVAYNPLHRWFYFPAMRRDEALLIKCYDSDSARARFTAHTAFHDPAAPPDAAPRESIEVRTLAFF